MSPLSDNPNLRFQKSAVYRLPGGYTYIPVCRVPGSFIMLERKWKAGDRIELNIPMNLYTKEMPDNADRRAVFYGPTLLAGALGEKEIEPIRGVPVFVSPDKQVCTLLRPTPDNADSKP